MPEYTIYTGDCLDILPTLEANSVDSIVTDPPYGLSNGVAYGLDNRIMGILRDVVLPDFDKLDAKPVKDGELGGILVSGSPLCRGEVVSIVESWIGVPKSSVDLNGDVVGGQVKIHDSNITSSVGRPDSVLVDGFDLNGGEFLGDYTLDLGNSWELAISDGGSSLVSELFFSGFSVPVIPVLNPCTPSPLARLCAVILGNEVIGLGDDALGQAFGSPLVLTRGGAVNAFMLRFDLRGGAIELRATNRASQNAATSFLFSPKLVRTSATASSLSPEFEPVRVSFVSLTADGTNPLHFHLWLHKEWINKLNKIIPRGGFMGKQWDATIPEVEAWREAYRVLKPGGHMLAFGGTRSWHRLGVALEEAGFEIRDTVMWVYGCLSDDTEILTTDGWKTYDMLSCDSTAMCYNVNSDSLELRKIEEVFTYEISDTAYHIQSDHTDQIVTREHRCLVERGGKYVFRKASTLELQETIPFLEGVPDVWSTIPYPRPHASNEKQILQQGMPSGSSGEGQQRRAPREAQADYVDLPCLWDEVLATSSIRGTYRQSDLQLPLQWGVAGSGMGKARTQGPRCLETGERSGISRTDDRRHESSMEGRNNVLQNTRQLSGCEVRALSSRVQGNGTQRWLCDGAPSDSGTTLGALSETHRSCTPQRPRPDEQQPRQFDAIQKQFGTQTIRGEGTTAPTLATVTPIHYDGVVWCVRVPTGAFVARRNGHVFVTGNSGFPKSRDIGKAIDAQILYGSSNMPAMKRTNQSRPGEGRTRAHSQNNGILGEERGEKVTNDNPATPEGAQWAGWGTALKPAWEPVIVARKPLLSTGVNVLSMVESQLRQRGITGEIIWKQRRVNGVEKLSGLTSSSSIEVLPTGATFVKSVAENEMPNKEKSIETNSGNDGENGTRQTQVGNGNWQESTTEDCESKSCRPMGESASVAEKQNPYSSSLTTSTVEEQNTDKQCMGKCTPNSAEKDSHQGIECFAGIATGLTGSMAHVHIIRDVDGVFLWPENLPKSIPSQKLTVAANVLAYGTGAINIDGCRVGTDEELGRPQGTMPQPMDWGNKSKKGEVFTTQGNPAGRWPANLVLSYPEDEIDQDGNPLPNPAKDEVLAGFPVTKSGGTGGGGKTFHGQIYTRPEKTRDSDTGSAARFFYCAKSSRSDRNEGLDGLGGLSKLRDDLTDEQRQYVMRELQKEGLV